MGYQIQLFAAFPLLCEKNVELLSERVKRLARWHSLGQNKRGDAVQMPGSIEFNVKRVR